MSKNIAQVFATNPITVNAATDLMYFGQAPYGVTNDAAMTYANFAAQFGAPFTPAALTEINDTNVTLTLGGTPSTALLQAVSITAGWSGSLALSRGGLAASLTASNGGIFYSTASAGAILSGTVTANLPLLSGSTSAPTWGSFPLVLAGSFTTSGAFSVTQTYTGPTNVTFPTTGTLATTSQLPTPAALTEINDTNITLTLGGTPATALLQAVSITAGWAGTLSLARGGSGTALTASAGAVTYSTASAMAFTAVGATGQLLTSTGTTAPAWTTATYPATTTINQLLYSSATNTVSGLATLNNGVLVTGATGVPALLANSGTPGFVLTANSGAPPSWAAISADGAITTINGDAGSITPSSGAVTISGGTTGLTTSGATSILNLTGTLKLTNGGTNASLTASNGGIFYSTASAGAILAGTATAKQMLQSGASTIPSWSSSTWPSTTTINQILFSSASNTVGGITTANSGVLVTSSGGVPSIGTTLPSGVQTNITQLGTITTGVWNGTLIALANGGTGAAITASNGGIFYSNASTAALLSGTATANLPLLSGISSAPTWGSFPIVLAGSFTTMGAFAVTQTYTGITNVTFPTSGTLATTAQLPTPAALTESNDTNVTLTLGGTPATALLQAVSITAGWSGTLSLARGGLAAAITASNGGIFYSNATTGALLAGTATAGQLLTSGASTTPAWTTSTYPATNAVNTLLYASSANVMAALATANSGVLVTSAGGVPSISTTLPSALTIPLPLISGVTNASNATAGNIGEVISSSVLNASAISLTTNTAANVTSIALTAGDWDIRGNVVIQFSVAGTISYMWSSQTSATVPDASLLCGTQDASGTIAVFGGSIFPSRINVSGSVTVFLSCISLFSSGTATACGNIIARRIR